jgi:hypothetical protein
MGIFQDLVNGLVVRLVTFLTSLGLAIRLKASPLILSRRANMAGSIAHLRAFLGSFGLVIRRGAFTSIVISRNEGIIFS